MSAPPISTHGAGEDPIFGRERELARLDELVDGLPERGAALLLLAAADGGALSDIFAAAAVIDGGEPSAEDFVPAVAVRLVELDGTRLAFRHPLVRSAIYQRASITERHRRRLRHRRRTHHHPMRIGGTWVHLRECLSCGHVGSCDSSPNRHATAHFHETQHPIVASFEPGEDWRYCYVDETLV